MSKRNFKPILGMLAISTGGAALLGAMNVRAEQASEDAVTRISVDAFQQAVIDRSHERVVVMDFYADWCSPCREMAPDLSAVAAEYEDRVSVVRVDGDEAGVLIDRFDVPGFPALIAFSEGVMVNMLKGAKPRDFLDQWFAVLAGTPGSSSTEKE